ncbi:MAG: tripartite tricarboxylate transporter substrate-binding protein [Telluria sp.]
MKITLRRLALIAQAITLFAYAAPASAADAYPSKPIRMVLGYPAGSGIDTVARMVAQRMEKTLGHQVYVDNKPGALGNIAAQNVATSAPDGYSILFTPNSAPVANVFLFKKLPFDPVRDFTPVATVGTLGFVVLVNAEAGQPNSLAELTAMLKKSPGKYSYGTGNATGQVAGALYTELAGVDALAVPYKGVPPAILDLIAKRVDFVMADASLAIPQIKGKRVKGLAVTEGKRIPALADLPTMGEAGVAGYDLSGWFGVFMPAKAPPEITRLLEKTIRDIVSDPAMAASMQAIGVTPWIGGGADLARAVATDTPKWGRIIQRAGIVAE